MKYFDYEYRVRYGDTDMMGISYYANYLIWFEAARTEYFRALGLPYTECEKQGIYLPVVEAQARYMGPSTYDDLLTIRTSVSEIRMSTIRFEYHVFKTGQEKRISQGYTVHVFVDGSMKPVRSPQSVTDLVECFQLLDDGPRKTK